MRGRLTAAALLASAIVATLVLSGDSRVANLTLLGGVFGLLGTALSVFGAERETTFPYLTLLVANAAFFCLLIAVWLQETG